jgi:hypothetical protein
MCPCVLNKIQAFIFEVIKRADQDKTKRPAQN